MQGLFWVWILHEIEWKDHVKIMYYKYPNLWNNTQRNKYRIQHGLPWHFLKFDVKCDSAHGTHDLPIVSVHKSKSPLQWSKMTIESVWNWMCSSRHKKSTRQKLAHSFHGRPKRERWIDTVLHFSHVTRCCAILFQMQQTIDVCLSCHIFISNHHKGKVEK